MADLSTSVAAVVIGRNEGARLIRCLESLGRRASPIIYVDSGSTDGSPEAARRLGAEVVALDMSRRFTAARARNAGIARLSELGHGGAFIQFVDGDCEMRSGWLEEATSFLEANPDIAAVCGRLRERFPEASMYNRMIDGEWDTPVGEVRSCGGIALIRRDALAEAGGYRESLIAGEEPELCFRLRASGWRIYRLAAEMAWHDAAMTRFGQWWTRARRAGYAFAEGAALHGSSPERFRVRERNRATLWGAAVPLATLLGAVLSPATLILLLAYPLLIVRMVRRGESLERAAFLTLGKVPEAIGVLTFIWGRLTGRGSRLIEYK